MTVSRILFEELFPIFRKSNNNYFAQLYEGLELDIYPSDFIRITVKINLVWTPIIAKINITTLHIKKLKELHEQLSGPF